MFSVTSAGPSGRVAWLGGCVTVGLLCITIAVIAFLRGREALRREEQAAYARLQRTMDQAFDVVLAGVRDGHHQQVRLDADFGVGTDRKMQRLAGIPHIKTISLELTDVTDEGIRHIASLPNLETLAVFGGNITDKGLGYLAGKPSIQNIVLDQTVVTEAGVAVLKTVPNLRFLIYYQEVVGPIPSGFEQRMVNAMKQLGQLEALQVGGNWISDDMIRDLQASLPNVRVRRLEKDDPRPYQPSGPK
jgi:hypothetical protein